MKESLLKKMITVVDGTVSIFKSDFYKFDLARLTSADEDSQFFWQVGNWGTHLLVLDYEGTLNKLRANNVYRFQFMRNPKRELEYLLSRRSGTLFHYDGEQLTQTSEGECNGIWEDFAKSVMDKIWVEFSLKEQAYWKRPIKVRFQSQETAKVVWDGLHGEDGDRLLELLQSFHRWERGSVNDEVVISRDWNGTDLFFSHNRDGHQVMCGGILFYDGKWHRHT